MNMTSQTVSRQTWLPDQIGDVLVKPLSEDSVALAAAGFVMAAERTAGYRVPVVNADPSASWVDEGAEITTSAADLKEASDVFHKLAGLVPMSSELANDSSPDAAELVGLGLARDIARQLDKAFFGARGASTVPPQGLSDLTGTGLVNASTKWSNVDPFTEAIYNAEQEGATLSAFVANPADALALAKLKDQAGSERPLLGTDPSMPTRRLLSGVPLLASPAVTKGTVWGIPADRRVVIAIRQDVTIERDASVYFSSDQIALRAIMRVAFLYPHEKAIQKITVSA